MQQISYQDWNNEVLQRARTRRKLCRKIREKQARFNFFRTSNEKRFNEQRSYKREGNYRKTKF